MTSNLTDNWVTADMTKFVVFILSHGRASFCKENTYNILRSCGYTGKVIIVCDNEDTTIEEYYKEFGKDNVYVFDKEKEARQVDELNNFNNRKCDIFARNAMWNIAKELGYMYFQQLDDDYYYFGHRRIEGAKKTLCYSLVAKWFVEFLLNTPDYVKTIAFAQGGDHIGGYDENILYKRKAMNSFFCLTSRPFKFIGTFNGDVNTYTSLNIQGNLFLTFLSFDLSQADTQQATGGAAELYKSFGTYVKSFTTVMIAPSCVQVRMMGDKYYRLHHNIKWGRCTPKIVSEEYKKK